MASPAEVDPYFSLSSEAQRAVDNVVNMGFSRPRAARAVDKIGRDEKEVSWKQTVSGEYHYM